MTCSGIRIKLLLNLNENYNNTLILTHIKLYANAYSFGQFFATIILTAIAANLGKFEIRHFEACNYFRPLVAEITCN